MQEPWEVENRPDTPRQAHYSHGSPRPAEGGGDSMTFQALGVLRQCGRDLNSPAAREDEGGRSLPMSSVPAGKSEHPKVDDPSDTSEKCYNGPASEHGSCHAEDDEDGSEWCSDAEKVECGMKDWLHPNKDVGCCRDGTYVGARGET